MADFFPDLLERFLGKAFLKGVFGGLGAHTFRNPVLLMHKRIMYGMMMGAVKG